MGEMWELARCIANDGGETYFSNGKLHLSAQITKEGEAPNLITRTSITADNNSQPVTNVNSKATSKSKPGHSSVPPTTAAALLAKWNLDLYLRHFSEVTGAGRSYIQRSVEAPARNPTGAMSNTTRFASTKTNQTVTTESDLTELPTVLMCERSDDVFFYVEQPQRLELSFEDGRRSVMTTPDFLIFFRDGPCICECKPKRELAALAIKQPHRYQMTLDGSYRSQPAEAAAAALGLSFRFITESFFEEIFLRNIEFLAVHYRSELRTPITDAEMTALLLRWGASWLSLFVLCGVKNRSCVARSVCTSCKGEVKRRRGKLKNCARKSSQPVKRWESAVIASFLQRWPHT